MSDDSKTTANGAELIVDLSDALRERISVFVHGHDIPMALVVGVLETLKTEIILENSVISSDQIDYE